MKQTTACILIRLGLVFIRATGAWDDYDLNALANMWTVCCVYQPVAVSVSFVAYGCSICLIQRNTKVLD